MLYIEEGQILGEVWVSMDSSKDYDLEGLVVIESMDTIGEFVKRIRA